MDALLTWLVELGLPESEVPDAKDRLAYHGVVNKDACVGVHTQDWKEVFPSSIGFRYLVRDAALSIPYAAELDKLAKQNSTIKAQVDKKQADGKMLQARLDKVKGILNETTSNLRSTTTSLYTEKMKMSAGEAELKRLQDEYESITGQVSTLISSISSTKVEVEGAKQAKENAINQAVTSGVIRQQVGALQMPSLDSVSISKSKKAPTTDWKGKMKWYVGGLARPDCEARLLQDKCQPGFFLVRDSSSADTEFSLSVRFPGSGPLSVKHYRIVRLEDGAYQLALKVRDGYSNINLPELISYYMNIGVGSGITLKEPAPPLPDANACPKCFAECTPGTKFCKTCGAKMA